MKANGVKKRVVVSGIGIVSPYGVGVDTFWQAVSSGRSAAKIISGFDVNDYPVRFAAEITDHQFDPRMFLEDRKSIKIMSRATQFAVVASTLAMSDAHLKEKEIPPTRFGVTLGVGGVGPVDYGLFSEIKPSSVKSEARVSTSEGDDIGHVFRIVMSQINPLTPLKILPNMAAAHIAINHQAHGSNYSIATACTSSSQATGEAYRQIQRGENDLVITGGTDSMVNPIGILGFNMLGVLSRNNQNYLKASRPFDKNRDGFMLGEGAAILILEELQHCLEREGKIYCEIVGYAASSDAFRITDEPPDGRGNAHVMRSALQDAQLRPDQIDYINAHGTSTVMNDKIETIAIKNVFGDYAYQIPISSTKSMIGHWVAACGAVELATCILSMQYGLITPTINHEEADPDCDLDYVPNVARKSEVKTALSNSFGFGGQNACLVVQRFDSRRNR